MKPYMLLIIGLLLSLNLSCKSSEDITNPLSENVIATFADEEITVEELVLNYNRNRNTDNIESSELKDFYPSYIDYRLKLYEGYQKGYHKDSTILAEFDDYASEIAKRFWVESKIKRERINTFNKRFDNELKAFHILIQTPENALPADTAEVYNTLLMVRDSLINGADPEKMNELYSSKNDGRPVGGQLSWITAGTTIKPFEDALYNLQPGEISMPVRSQFGYHLILLQEVRKRTPKRLIKHLFVRKNDHQSGYEKIKKAYKALEADSSWSNVLQIYTEDPSTKNRDGSLGWVGYGGRFPPELIELAYQADPNGMYSKPQEVSYGYHILKVDSVQIFKNETQKENFIINRLEELGRLNPDSNELFDRISREKDLKINHENFSRLRHTQLPLSKPSGENHPLDLIHFNGKTYTTADFQYWLNNSANEDEIMQAGDLITSYRDHIINENLVDFTRNRFPEFANQVDHFLEGLIVFKINEEQIWNKNAVDRRMLRNYYQENREKYKREKLLIYTEVTTKADSLMPEVHRKLTNGMSINDLSNQYGELTITKDSTFNLHDPLYKELRTFDLGEFTQPKTVNGTSHLYILNNIENERILSFEEALDQVFSDYQPIWENEYLNRLKDMYNLKLYPENL